MNKEIAIIIPNFNKKDYILKCIESVLNQTFKDFDLYVVDNASTDGSAEEIENIYKEQITLVKNKFNKGSSGGFASGIQEALKKNYRYIYLMDNDVVLDSSALSSLYSFMQEHRDYGVVGSIIFMLDSPNTIQEYGSFIDWNTYNLSMNYNKYVDNGDLPELIECDYVPAGSMLVRTEVIQHAGSIDERYFVYWEDIDWCYRIKLSGYKVAAYYSSKVWHKGGGQIRKDTLPHYYFWRNRINFFLTYCAQNKLQDFYDKFFNEAFNAIFFCLYGGKFNTARTILMAIRDGLNKVRGQASNDRILPKEIVLNDLEETIKEKRKIGIRECGDVKILRSILKYFERINPECNLVILTDRDDTQELVGQFRDYRVVRYGDIIGKEFDFVCFSCNHISNVRTSLDGLADAYMDQYLNFIFTNEQRNMIKSYDIIYNFAKILFFSMLNKNRNNSLREI